MGRMQGRGRLHDQLRRPGSRKRAILLERAFDGCAVHVLHRDERVVVLLGNGVDLYNERVVDAGNHSRLRKKPLRRVLPHVGGQRPRQDLHRSRTQQDFVLREKHDTHSAASNDTTEPKRAKPFAHQGGGFCWQWVSCGHRHSSGVTRTRIPAQVKHRSNLTFHPLNSVCGLLLSGRF